jgi:tellurite resistance-related uncharacterized protein
VRRQIIGWHDDDDGDWVAELSCLHGQHVRHRPPFRVAPWVETEEGRRRHVGTDLDCPLCDRTELPEHLTVLRTTDTWDQDTVPAALTRRHRVAPRRWGLLHIVSGAIDFWAATTPELERPMVAGDRQPIPPDVEHRIVLSGPVRLRLDFLGPDQPSA